MEVRKIVLTLASCLLIKYSAGCMLTKQEGNSFVPS